MTASAYTAPATRTRAARRLILPLALAQFICSFAGSNMNVMINDISDDLNTSVKGVQTTITLFLLIMAVLMIPCSKLTDRWGRKRCFMGGLTLYGIGAAAGPLIGGVITTAISWRAAFIFQVLVVALIVLLSRRLEDPLPADPTRPFDAVGAILSAVGMFFIVFGIVQAGYNNTLLIVSLVVGIVLLAGFFLYIRARERKGKEPLLSSQLFKNRMCNLALVTQNIQWLLLLGTSFVVSVFLQEVRGYSAIRTGLALTPATVGILISSAAAERFANRRSQRTLVIAGFAFTCLGMVLQLVLVRPESGPLRSLPGLFLIGFGVGAMLTSSVNIVQSSFPDRDQGDISGLSRSVSNLGSSLGTALAGSVLVAASHPGGRPFALALGTLVVITLIGLVLALLLPRQAGRPVAD